MIHSNDVLFHQDYEKASQSAAKHTTLIIFNQKTTRRIDLKILSNTNFLIKKSHTKKISQPYKKQFVTI